jgi:hypothetical protein
MITQHDRDIQIAQLDSELKKTLEAYIGVKQTSFVMKWKNMLYKTLRHYYQGLEKINGRP